METVYRPSLYTRQHCLDRTRVFVPSLLPLCSARHVPAPPCRAILPERRRWRRGAASCRSSATSLSYLSLTPQARSSAASQLVQSLAEDLDSLKQRPLSPACGLSIYRLTKLCTTSQGFEVALALTLVGVCWIRVLSCKFTQICKFLALEQLNKLLCDSCDEQAAQSRPYNCRTADYMTARASFCI